jgi:hypothetical protein
VAYPDRVCGGVGGGDGDRGVAFFAEGLVIGGY